MLTATIDRRGRVILSTATAGTSFAWGKDGLVFTTTATGSAVDHRPNKNYVYVPAQSCTESGGSFANDYNAHHLSTAGNARKTTTINGMVSFTFTGVEFGVVLDQPTDNEDPSNTTFAECRIDGGAWETIDIDSKAGYNLYSVISWGKSGLSNTSHTVDVRLKSDVYGVGMTFDGYFYSNRSTALGVPVEYSVVIDGTITETATVTPLVDRGAVIADWVDQIVTQMETYTYGQFVGFIEITDWLGALAMAYIITGDSRLVGCADKLYNAYIAHSNSTTGVLSDNNGLTWNGRTGYNFCLAFKAFGESKYLTIVDRIVTYLKNSWPKSSMSYGGTTYNNIWLSLTSGGTIDMDGNRWSCPAYSCCLAYNEPTSAHYHNATLRQRILDNTAWSMTSVDPITGEIVVGPDHDLEPTRVYGSFQFEHIRLIYETFSDQIAMVAAMEKAADWLASFGTAEPWWWEDSLSTAPDGSTIAPNTETIIWDCNAFDKAGVTIPADYIDRAYSAACAGQYCHYDPRGSADAVMSLDSLLRFTVFWASRSAYMAGLPSSVYAYGTPPNIVAFTIPATSTSLTVPTTALAATDDVGVTGYKITETSTAPLASDAGWSSTPQTEYTFGSAGAKTLWAWAKDGDGNVSAGVSADVVITVGTTDTSIKHIDGTQAGAVKHVNGSASGAIKRKVGGSWQ